MSDIKWIKLNINIFNNRKIKSMLTPSCKRSKVLIWIMLLCYAGELNMDGTICFDKDIPFSDSELAKQLGITACSLKNALKTFSEYNMIEIDEKGIIKIINWELYQNQEKMKQIKENRNSRNKRYKEKVKKNSFANTTQRQSFCTENVTESERNRDGIVTDSERNRNGIVTDSCTNHLTEFECEMSYEPLCDGGFEDFDEHGGITKEDVSDYGIEEERRRREEKEECIKGDLCT